LTANNLQIGSMDIIKELKTLLTKPIMEFMTLMLINTILPLLNKVKENGGQPSLKKRRK